MEKYKYLIKNMGLLTLSNFAIKLLSFFLVPLYTNILSTSDYGTYDLFNTTVSLLIPLLTVNIQEAVLRFSMDKDTNPNAIWYIGCRYSSISCIVVIVALVFNHITGLLPSLKQYEFEFFFLYLFTTFTGLMLYFARGLGRVADLSIAGVIASAVTIFCNIIFLVFLKLGITGCFLATILGLAAQLIYLLVRAKIWKNVKYYKDDVPLRIDMVNYSKPMIANAISWWVNNASDRYIVTWICGIAVNGIYSVSYKIPSIMSILQSIFSQAWTLSATKEFDREDKDNFFINIYNSYNFLLIISCSALIIIDKPLAKILFAKDFYSAWQYVPFLMISTIFSGMATFLGGILSALKKSNLFAKSSVITAIINTILNIILVFMIGPVGSAISTLVAYFLMWLIRLEQVKDFINLRVNIKRDLIAYLILVVQSVALLVINVDSIFNWYQIGFFIMLLILYYQELKTIIGKFIIKKVQ